MSKILHSKLSKVKIAAMMLLILLASIWFALNSQPIQPVTHYAPGNPAYEVMRRESDVNRSILVNLPSGQTLVWEVA
jgi:hypothetical protein